MKDLGHAQKILGMEISRYRKKGVMCLSQQGYIQKVLLKFDRVNAKLVATPYAQHFKLSSGDSPKTDEEKQTMEIVPYSSAVWSLMYSIICTRPDLAHSVSVVNRFMCNPRKQHW